MSTYNESQRANEGSLSERSPMCTRQEIEEIVVLARLELYNRDLPCGPKAIRNRIDTLYLVKPLPSESTIAHILERRCLTHGRTGCYEG